ncbi:SDR family NA [Sesbania bispinosa]|nr:SDR family NA [Sesbania bispinosa]
MTGSRLKKEGDWTHISSSLARGGERLPWLQELVRRLAAKDVGEEGDGAVPGVSQWLMGGALRWWGRLQRLTERLSTVVNVTAQGTMVTECSLFKSLLLSFYFFSL